MFKAAFADEGGPQALAAGATGRAPSKCANPSRWRSSLDRLATRDVRELIVACPRASEADWRFPRSGNHASTIMPHRDKSLMSASV